MACFRIWKVEWMIAIVALGFCSSLESQVQTSRLYVDDSMGDSIVILDLNALHVVGSIKVGERPHGLAMQADGRRLFTTVESDHTLKIIDTETNAILSTIK